MKKVLSSLELLNDLAICLTEERILASQVAVLTTIARFPGASSGVIVGHTGLSLTNVGRILGYLFGSGDVMFVRRSHGGGVGVDRTGRRRFYVTRQGVVTIGKLVRHLRWSGCGEFGVVAINHDLGKEIFEL
ncbi:MAG: hypothetical protein RR553_09840 [Akkermansia sp.]